MTPEVVDDAASSFLDAANVDLKGATREFYKHHCRGRIDAVMETIERMHGLGIWVEVTTLLVPGLNDSEESLSVVASFVASVSRSMPWHVSRFHPDLDLTHLPPTPRESLERAVAVGREAGLEHIYVGNAWGTGSEDTVCPSCGTVVMARVGFSTQVMGIDAGRCTTCGHAIPGVFA
jgi:pyruvate formate lyase activating enzyme